MKRTLLIIISLYSLLLAGYGQSIPSYLDNLKGMHDLYLSRTNNVEQIIADQTIYYSNGGNLKEKWIYNFVDSLNIFGQLFRDGQLNSNFEYEFDTLGKMIRNNTCTRLAVIGWQTKIITYEYEAGKLKFEKKHNSEMQLIDYVMLEYDTDNRPVRMSMYNDLDELTAYETAEYDDTKMLYYYKVFESSGTLISDEIVFFNSDVSSNVTNTNGDLVLMKLNPEKNICHQLEYVYDEKGNWIERKWYRLYGKKKDKMIVSSRKIKYTSSN